jgi:hypothetical protein
MTESSFDDVGVSLGSIDTLMADEFIDYAGEIASTWGWAPAVYSRTDNAVRAVTSFYIGPVLDTQRRRQERVGA